MVNDQLQARADAHFDRAHARAEDRAEAAEQDRHDEDAVVEEIIHNAFIDGVATAACFSHHNLYPGERTIEVHGVMITIEQAMYEILHLIRVQADIEHIREIEAKVTEGLKAVLRCDTSVAAEAESIVAEMRLLEAMEARYDC